jgi:ribosomal protein L11 methyltransferase
MLPRFPVVAIEADPSESDELCALLFELGASGIEQRDDDTHPSGICRLALETSEEPTTAALQAPSPSRLTVPYADLETPEGDLRFLEARAHSAALSGQQAGDRVLLLACFDGRDEAEEALGHVVQIAPGARCRLVELWGDEWRDRYRKAFAPFDLTATLTVVPPWLESPVPRGPSNQLLIIDPGRAFGTGLNATTSLVAAILEEHAAKLAGAQVLDVGTGSGILGIGALRLGAAQVVAIDSDPQALSAALANVARNGLSDRMSVSSTPLDRVEGSFDWVLANIEQRVLCTLAPGLVARVRPAGMVVLSGVLEPQLPELLGAYGVGEHVDGPRFELLATRRRTVDRDSWVAVLLKRASAP